MSRFSPDTIERVREAANIVEIVSAYTDLRRQGERFVGLCPFHDERTPSFSVKPRDGFYYCFGCEAGGDAIRFVQEKEGLAFPDAVEALGERYGIEIERESEDPKVEEARRRRGRLGEALTRVSAFYESYLWEAPKAAKAKTYLLEERGLGEEVLRNFGVGFAPSVWDAVLVRGQQAGYSVDELLAAGLIQRSQNKPGKHYDRFRGRITFPVKDHRGRVVGFGARGMGPDAKPKYLNSPEGELYRKSRTLYGIDRARGPIARGGRAVVVRPTGGTCTGSGRCRRTSWSAWWSRWTSRSTWSSAWSRPAPPMRSTTTCTSRCARPLASARSTGSRRPTC